MKKNLIYLVLFSLLFVACSKDDDENSNDSGGNYTEIYINGETYKFYTNNCQFDEDLELFTFGIYDNQNIFKAENSIDCLCNFNPNKHDSYAFNDGIGITLGSRRYSYESGTALLLLKDINKQVITIDLNGTWTSTNDASIKIVGRITLQYEID